MTVLSTKLRNRLVLPGGVLVALLGFVVMLGWWRELEAIVQVQRTLVPMQFNTALGLFLSGTSLWAIAFRRTVPALLLGAALAGLGLASVSQYLLGIELGIDQFFLHSPVTVATSHPGRMAPNTALCFVMSGSALLLLASGSAGPARRLVAELLGAMIAGIALIGLVGYGLGISAAYGWGSMTQMAVHTAGGFLVFGFGLFITAWLTVERNTSRPPNWLAMPIGIAAVAVLLSLSQGLSIHESRQIEGRVSAEARLLRTVFENHLQNHVLALQRLASRWETTDMTTDEWFRVDATRNAEDYRGYAGIGWADASGSVTAQVTDGNFERPATLGELSPRLVHPRASEQASAVILLPYSGADASRVGIVITASVQRGATRRGYLYGVLSMRGMLSPLTRSLPTFGFSVRNDDEAVFTAGTPPRQLRWRHEELFRSFGDDWTVAAWPTDEGLATIRSTVFRSIVLGSAFGTLVLLIAIHFAQVAVRRAHALRSVNHKLNEARAELERLAMFDTLTALGNRNFFGRQLELSLATAARTRQALCLMILDLNGFKEVNDTLGHKAGDVVLRTVAERLSRTLRSSDQMFRLGGDEFAVLLNPGTAISGALVLADKLQERIAKPVDVNGSPQPIGVSIGIAVYPQHAASPERLLREADVAMYQAKKSGTPIAIASDVGATMTMKVLDSDRLSAIAAQSLAAQNSS